MSIVLLKNVKKDYPLGRLSVQALKGIDLEITAGDFVSVAGPSGSGKTTMMNLIGLLDRPSSGQIFIQDQDVSAMGRQDLTRIRHESIGFVFQSFNLLPVLNVYENIELPLVLGRNSMGKRARRDWVEHLVREVGLQDRMRHRPAELSGGQQQRVAIARALASRPPVVIADEPTANLDSATGERILNLMKLVNQEEGTTFLFSTHDPAIWESADHVIFLHDGRVASEKRR